MVRLDLLDAVDVWVPSLWDAVYLLVLAVLCPYPSDFDLMLAHVPKMYLESFRVRLVRGRVMVAAVWEFLRLAK